MLNHATRLVTLSLLLAAVTLATPRAQSASDYIIGPSDILAIQLFDQPDLGGRYTVEADGSLAFPLVGRVKAAGLSLRAFETELKKKLAPDYFRNPQVTVAVETYRSQHVFVQGEVRQPGQIVLTGGMTLLEALSRAGSALPTASGEVVVVRPPASGKARDGESPEFLRANLKAIENGDLKQDVQLRAGDQVYVARAESIYVFGQVRSPGAYAIQPGMTVLQALSLAGGTTENAAMNRIDIVRMVNGDKKKVRVKLNDLVRPGDTVIVPERYF
jgi:polysaccharide export outer membrane protein